MSDIKKYVELLESSYNQVVNEQSDDDCYLFSHDAEKLYESSGISLDVLMENRIDWLRDNIMHKLEPLADKEGKPVEELFNWIIDQDPSTKKQYSQWLMKILVGKKAQSSLNDLEHAKQVLTKYEELKSNKKLKPEHKDLNRFKSIDELSRTINDTEQNIKSEYDAIEKRARNESKIIHEDDVWLVVIPKTEYAAGYWGRNSLWCTAAGFPGGRQEERTNNAFNAYSQDGNLYIVMNKKKPKDIYQFQISGKEFKDSEDRHFGEEEDHNRIISKFPKLKKAIYKEIAYSTNIHKMREHYKFLFGDMKDDEVEYLEDLIYNDPTPSYEYAEYNYKYARDVIGGRFKKGEDIIAKIAEYSYLYAKNVIGGRFEQGEDAIAKYAEYSYLYAKNVIGGRFEQGEDEIAKHTKTSSKYASDVVKGKFEKGEDAIAKDPYYSFAYATMVIKDRFKKGEPIMSRQLDTMFKQKYKKLTGIRL